MPFGDLFSVLTDAKLFCFGDVCAGANPFVYTRGRKDVLADAARSGLEDVCGWLLALYLNTGHQRVDTSQALLAAAQEGHVGTCRVLMQGG